MIICTGTFIPYEYEKRECLAYVEERCHGLKKSLRLVEKDNEHLTIRCPLSGDYLDIVGTTEDIEWLHKQLTIKQWYRTS